MQLEILVLVFKWFSKILNKDGKLLMTLFEPIEM